jgi:hypothetical protein
VQWFTGQVCLADDAVRTYHARSDTGCVPLHVSWLKARQVGIALYFRRGRGHGRSVLPGDR